MDAKKFTESIRRRVVNNDFKTYGGTLNNPTNITDPVWRPIIPIYQSLSPEQKDSFFKLLRLIQVNTLSHILGILDGSTYLDEERVEFLLTANGTTINGDLQDLFLEVEDSADQP